MRPYVMSQTAPGQTAAPAKKFDRAANPLRCYICVRAGRPGTHLRVANDVVRRRRSRRHEGPKTFDQVPVDCLTCGHQWYSMHKEAIAISRKADLNLARRHGGQR
jgi:hypothetical protein